MSWKLPQGSSHLSGPNHHRINPGRFSLPSRLFSLLAALPKSPRLLDVGADHGLLALSALRLGVTSEAWALDRSDGPLAGAAARTFLTPADRLSFVRSDGLRQVSTRTDDVVVIAGMSGDNAGSIVDDALRMHEASPRVWAFQVNDGHEGLRLRLTGLGFAPISEWYIAESKRFFLNQIWVNLGRPSNHLSDVERLLGPLAISGRAPLLEAWVECELARIDAQLQGLKASVQPTDIEQRIEALRKRRTLLTRSSACH